MLLPLLPLAILALAAGPPAMAHEPGYLSVDRASYVDAETDHVRINGTLNCPSVRYRFIGSYLEPHKTDGAVRILGRTEQAECGGQFVATFDVPPDSEFRRGKATLHVRFFDVICEPVPGPRGQPQPDVTCATPIVAEQDQQVHVKKHKEHKS
jgi:hypothetical protein